MSRKEKIVKCEVLTGKNALGWTVELRLSEIQNKEHADEYFKLFEKMYKTITLSLDSSEEKENEV